MCVYILNNKTKSIVRSRNKSCSAYLRQVWWPERSADFLSLWKGFCPFIYIHTHYLKQVEIIPCAFWKPQRICCSDISEKNQVRLCQNIWFFSLFVTHYPTIQTQGTLHALIHLSLNMVTIDIVTYLYSEQFVKNESKHLTLLRNQHVKYWTPL